MDALGKTLSLALAFVILTMSLLNYDKNSYSFTSLSIINRAIPTIEFEIPVHVEILPNDAYTLQSNELQTLTTALDALIKQEQKIVNITNEIIRLASHVDKNTARNIAESVYFNSKKYNIPPNFVLTIIYTESRFDPNAVGKSEDTGLMQIVPRYHKDRLKRFNVALHELTQINSNIQIGCDILAEAKKGRPNTDKTLWYIAFKYNGSKRYANVIMHRYNKLFSS